MMNSTFKGYVKCEIGISVRISGTKINSFSTRPENEFAWKIDSLREEADKLRNEARDEQAKGDRIYWPIFNLDSKNPNSPEEETHDPDVLLDKYKSLLLEIEDTQNELKTELASALSHHF